MKTKSAAHRDWVHEPTRRGTLMISVAGLLRGKPTDAALIGALDLLDNDTLDQMARLLSHTPQISYTPKRRTDHADDAERETA